MAHNELSLTIPSLHKQVGCCSYSHTKKGSAAFQKKRFTVTPLQLGESRIEFTTVSAQVGQLEVLISRQSSIFSHLNICIWKKLSVVQDAHIKHLLLCEILMVHALFISKS